MDDWKESLIYLGLKSVMISVILMDEMKVVLKRLVHLMADDFSLD